MKALLVELRIVVLSVKAIFNLNLGDIVRHNGKRYVLSQGVSKPSWNIGEVGGGEYLEYIHEDDFRKERTLSNAVHSFRFMHRFYCGYWRDIWESYPCVDIVRMTIALWSRRVKERETI